MVRAVLGLIGFVGVSGKNYTLERQMARRLLRKQETGDLVWASSNGDEDFIGPDNC